METYMVELADLLGYRVYIHTSKTTEWIVIAQDRNAEGRLVYSRTVASFRDLAKLIIWLEAQV